MSDLPVYATTQFCRNCNTEKDYVEYPRLYTRGNLGNNGRALKIFYSIRQLNKKFQILSLAMEQLRTTSSAA